MLMQKWLIFISILLMVLGCRKDFRPTGTLTSSSKYLVVDGVINTGTDSTFIKLSTTKIFDTVVVTDPVKSAQVIVESDAGGRYPLTEITAGTYSANPLNLNETPKYRLRIKTADQKEYLSDYVTVKNSPAIDSIGFNALNDGVHIYVNTHDATNRSRYYRWEYNEDWRFHTNYFSDNTAPGNYYCFAKDVSSNINIANSAKLSSDIIYQAPISVIPSSSEKLSVKYSILVRQYALSSDAYAFWENLQKNTSKLGSIFDAQPSLNQTNYHNIADPNEIVIGYLSVGSYAYKRIFISVSQLLPTYQVNNGLTCKIDTAYYYHAVYYFPTPAGDGVDISGKYPGFIGLKNIYEGPPGPFNAPNHITYTRTECADCTVRGTLKQPSFWK